MNTDFSSLYPALTHNLFLTVFCIIAVAFGMYFYKKDLENKKNTWIELTLICIISAVIIGSFFDGETLFSSLIAKGMLFLLFFFSTGRIILLLKKNKEE